MGIFDKLKKKTENRAEVQKEDVQAAGWDAITAACEAVYPAQKDPKHYGTLISWHFVTFGLSELYQKESDDKEISGYGMEFTFKLKKDDYEDEEAEIKCVCGILQTIARITFTKGEIFGPYEYLYTGQTQGIDTKMQSAITGFITVPDKQLKSIVTPNGKVDFVAFIGATDAELTAVRNHEMTAAELYEKIGSDVTDYKRKTVI